MLGIYTTDHKDRATAYRTFGRQKVRIVVELGLGACIGEWWHIADRLAEHGGVLIYERAGISNSKPSKNPRTPQAIAEELKLLLDTLPHEEKLILIAHSQGGLYAQQFARRYPDMVQGLILLDPLTAEDNRFKTLLTPAEYKMSGVEKASNLGLFRVMALLKLGFLIKLLVKNAPPFYYYSHFSRAAKKYILRSYTKAASYKTAMAEYRLSHSPEHIDGLKSAEGFPPIPVALLTHSCEICAGEIMEFGGATSELAIKIEDIWQDIMKAYLSFGSVSRHFLADKSGHYIHLTQPELLDEAIAWIEKECMQSEALLNAIENPVSLS